MTHALVTAALVGSALVVQREAGDPAVTWYCVGALAGVLAMIAEAVAVVRRRR